MQYGKPIDIVNANRLFKLFIDIKKRANPGIER